MGDLPIVGLEALLVLLEIGPAVGLGVLRRSLRKRRVVGLVGVEVMHEEEDRGPVFAEGLARVGVRRPELRVVIPVAQTVVAEVTAAAAGLLPAPVLVLPDAGEAVKHTAFAAADLALVTSGTVTLEMAAAATPMVSAYRTSWLTAAILRRLVRVDTANLVNLVGGENVVPEFLQEHCQAEPIAAALLELLDAPAGRLAQLAAFEQVLAALGRGGEPPSVRAARSVLEVLGRG